MDWNWALTSLIRLVAAVIIGALVGNERARHGRAAGMRTHILVCLGACMTSLTSAYVAQYTVLSGDVFRIPAQVVSGIGFLGAGMIILKGNNTITGLTTAAGVWTTATAGLALGYGFYFGAVVVAILLMITLMLFSKFEKNSKSTMVLYAEIEDGKKVNSVIKAFREKIEPGFKYTVFSPKTEKPGNVGINLVFKSHIDLDLESLCEVDGVVFIVEE